MNEIFHDDRSIHWPEPDRPILRYRITSFRMRDWVTPSAFNIKSTEGLSPRALAFHLQPSPVTKYKPKSTK